MQTKGDYMGHYAENGIIENPIGTLNKKDYKLKRPEKGYNTPAEREWSAWSDVSDWELFFKGKLIGHVYYVGTCLLYTSPSPRDATLSRMPSSA